MAKPENAPLARPGTAGAPALLSYLVGIGAGGLLLAGTLLGLIFWVNPVGEALKLGHLLYHEDGFNRLKLPLTTSRYFLLRGILAASAALGLGLLLGLRTGTLWQITRTEWRLARGRIAVWWGRLPVSAKAIAGGLVAVLLATRTAYLLYYPLSTDEVASYDYFARQGPLAISSFYPIPNNHIFYNWLAWPLATLGWSPRFVMRLPTLLLGTAGSVAGYALLARRAGLRVATLATGLVGLLPLWVYYAAAGRGYFVQLCFLQIGFFAALELLRPVSAYRHLSWLAFVASSVLGLYTIPTYAYPLASLGLALGIGFATQRRWQHVAELAVATSVVATLAAVLYLPVGMVSGWPQLLGNRYVRGMRFADFYPLYRGRLNEQAAELFAVPLRAAGLLWLGTALVGGLVIRRWYSGEIRRLAGLAWLLLALPLLLMALQRVFPPTRTLLYVSYGTYLLGALATERLLQRYKRAARWRWPLLMAAVLGVGGVRLGANQAQLQAARHEAAQREQAYHWLLAQPRPAGRPTQVGMDAPLHELFFAHYAQQVPPVPALRLHAKWPRERSTCYDYLVLGKRIALPTAADSAAFLPAYRNDDVTIYVRAH